MVLIQIVSGLTVIWNVRRESLVYADEEFVIGTIGRLDPVKNHAGLIRSFACLAKEGASVRLLIVGDGPERSNLEALRESLGLGPKCVFAGYRSDTERFYGIFDTFVLNSFAEGMSNTLLEAMSCALPVVCTPVGANVELVEDGITGTLIPADDEKALLNTFLRLRHSQALCGQIGASAREFILRSFSLSWMIEQYNKLYLQP
jgi:glycosyltransferase involved in cell wall biosynthesis